MLDRLRSKLTILVRRRLEGRPCVLSLDEIANANFYQFKKGTAEFFHRRLGHTKVKVHQTPHHAFATALAEGSEARGAAAEGFYRDYLQASWGGADPVAIESRIAAFRESFAFHRRRGFRRPAILTVLPTDDSPYVVDGNHRMAFAAALRQEMPAVVWPADLAFLAYCRVPGFYGTGNKNLPYQSVILGGQEVIGGRRADIVDRLAMVPTEVIAGRSVLDVACNVGMSALQAKALGAASCLGMDVSADLVDLASRFAAVSGVYPAVSFTAFNVDDDRLPSDAMFDTAFMFSLIDHLRNRANLVRIARDHVRRFVVFEGHPGGQESDYADFFRDGGFQSVVELGRLHTSRFQRDQRRQLWLCTKG